MCFAKATSFTQLSAMADWQEISEGSPRFQAHGQGGGILKNGSLGFWSKSLSFLLPKILEWALVSKIQIKFTIKKIVLSHAWTSPDAELGFSISAKFLSVYVHNFEKLSCYHQNSLAFSFRDTGLRLKIFWARWKQIESKSNPKHQPPSLFFQEQRSAPRQSHLGASQLGYFSILLSWSGPILCVQEWALGGGHDSKSV